jgi:hypothetical protein
MDASVRMEHPNLPGQTIVVSPLAVPHHQAAGWVLAPEPEPAPRKPKTTDAPADAGASASTDPDSEPTKRRRSSPTKEES